MGSRLFVGPWRQIAQCGAAPPFFELPTGPLTRERPMRCLGHLSPRQHKEEGFKKLCVAKKSNTRLQFPTRLSTYRWLVRFSLLDCGY